MASDQSFVEFVCEQTDFGSALTFKKMFGEYALYLDGKVVAFVCDNHLFVKPTTEGKQVLGAVDEQPAYPGSKVYFRIGAEIDDRELLHKLLLTTARALPQPKPKSPKKKKPV